MFNTLKTPQGPIAYAHLSKRTYFIGRMQYAPTVIITMLSFLRGNDIFFLVQIPMLFTNGRIRYYLATILRRDKSRCRLGCMLFATQLILGINVGLTIEPLAQPTATSTQSFSHVKWVAYYFTFIPKPNKAPKVQITTQYIIKKKAYWHPVGFSPEYKN